MLSRKEDSNLKTPFYQVVHKSFVINIRVRKVLSISVSPFCIFKIYNKLLRLFQGFEPQQWDVKLRQKKVEEKPGETKKMKSSSEIKNEDKKSKITKENSSKTKKKSVKKTE